MQEILKFVFCALLFLLMTVSHKMNDGCSRLILKVCRRLLQNSRIGTMFGIKYCMQANVYCKVKATFQLLTLIMTTAFLTYFILRLYYLHLIQFYSAAALSANEIFSKMIDGVKSQKFLLVLEYTCHLVLKYTCHASADAVTQRKKFLVHIPLFLFNMRNLNWSALFK